jgi:hypothetical protein
MNVFICHAPSDARTASKLALDLLKRGFEVWIDQPNPQGDPVDPEVRRKALAEGMSSAEVFLVMISPTALTSPDLFEQVDMALERKLRIVQVIRQEASFTSAVAKKFVDTEIHQLGRTNYDEGLHGLLRALGADPENIVRDIVSTLEVDLWLPGKWDVKFINPRTHVEGIADFIFKKDQVAEGNVTVVQGTTTIWLRVIGTWEFIDDRFTIQGWSKMAMSIEEAPLPKHMTYVLSLRVTDLQRGLFKGESSIGDEVVFQKVSDSL